MIWDTTYPPPPPTTSTPPPPADTGSPSQVPTYAAATMGLVLVGVVAVTAATRRAKRFRGQ